ncbi:response regulator transcription factor [Halegenticoccus tardaugens]|uniref:response regulator transcription factor n=1 Tax=Halegenticoccus tardaugens TaxID=2071624 RepID=UPI00100B31DE|nr:HalX domain-containing protein [Halegenticoccus tardaugens]
MSDEPPLVLVVEDEPDLADLYAAWLSDGCRIRTAYGGRDALSALDAAVDVVLLDRRMPGFSGDDVLAAVRDRDLDCRVAMVTAVEPDVDVIEMGFDDYLVKPVAKEALRETVSNLHRRSAYDAGVRELFSLASKKALLESERSGAELREHDEYVELCRRIRELRADLDDALREIDDGDAFADVARGGTREGSADDFGR